MKRKVKKLLLMESEWVSDSWKGRQVDAEKEAAKRLMMTVKNGHGAYDLAYAKKLLEKAIKEMLEHHE